MRAEFSASFLILYFGSEMPQSFSWVSVLSKYEIEKKLAAKEWMFDFNISECNDSVL